MSLILEIEFLAGVCRAARGPASGAPDWPPQPDRVFSALVSAWAARGERDDDRSALEWLEAQAPPTIHAGEYTARTAPDVFVPPNDFQTPTSELSKLKWYRDYLARGRRPPEKGGYERMWRQAISTYPSDRQRKERRFPVAYLEDPTMALVWTVEPEPELLVTLDEVARDVGYVGHSASLVRCRFRCDGSSTVNHPATPAQRRIYPGRLAELQRAHDANPARPMIQPGAAIPRTPAPEPEPRAPGWLVLEVVDGVVPDIRAAALVGRVLRRTLMSGYRGTGKEDAIPEIVSGHTPDGTPTRLPHIAIVPMPFAGFAHADGRVFGFALVPPPHAELHAIAGFRAAFEEVAPYDPGEERRIVELNAAPLRGPLRLAPAGEVTKRSLDPDPYLQPARVWASVTPMVLDRHLKRHDDAEVRELIADSCVNAGLPRPDPGNIQVGKHSAVEGSPPARPVSGGPPWTRWRVPEPLASRSLIHAVIDFGDETAGPVLLGAGRFTGLGLFRRVGA
ncbi:MAG: type I-U CRISPR-associated protein Csb2 [Spirochaetaceae bacterium]|nr:type I-U CRISPR-associated protein Csb2 [Spirochaetaceae bacterium]